MTAGRWSEQAGWKRLLVASGALAVGGALGLGSTGYLALGTGTGLRLDDAAWNSLSNTALASQGVQVHWRSVSHLAIAALMLACAALLLVRRRFDLAFGSAILVVGANLTTYWLQHQVLTRPDLTQLNGLPSQHTTLACALALSAVVLAPPSWRSVVALGAAGTTTLVAVVLVLGRWHRPSDVIAAAFVCVGWAAAGLLAAGLVRRRPGDPTRGLLVLRRAAPLALMASWLVGGALALWGAEPQPGLDDPVSACLTVGLIGLVCSACVVAVTHVADRQIG